MDFTPDLNNNDRNKAFLQTTKNQAKKLFKLAKNNQLKIEIENLSQAQQIVAQIKGFPNWHALEKTLSNTILDGEYALLNKEVTNANSTLETEINNDETILELKEYKSLPYIENDGMVSTLISIDSIPVDIAGFMGFMKDLTMRTKFLFNMGFHNINVFLSQQKAKKSIKQNYQYFEKYKNIGINQELFNELFNIDIDLESYSDFRIGGFIEIMTYGKMIEEHYQFCKILQESIFSSNFSFKKTLDKNETIQYYKNTGRPENLFYVNKTKDGKTGYCSEFNLNEFAEETSIENQFNTKLIRGLQYLSQRNHIWNMEININSNGDKHFSLRHSMGEDDDVFSRNQYYLQGLYKSLIKTNEYSDTLEMFPFNSKKSHSLPWLSGIPIINHTDNKIDFYDTSSSVQNFHNNLIYAKHGSGKSFLLNMLNLNNCFGVGRKELPQLGIIDIGSSSKSFIQLLQNLFPQEKEAIQYHEIKNEVQFSVNIFDTRLGERYPTDSHEKFLVKFLCCISSDENNILNEGYEGFIFNLVKSLYKENVMMPKQYQEGINKEIDSYLVDYKMNTYRASWWEVVDFISSKKEFKLAELAQRYAVPLWTDLISSIQNDEIKALYGKSIINGTESYLQYFSILVSQTSRDYPILNNVTTFTLENAKVAVMDLNHVALVGREDNNQTTIMYMLARYILNTQFKYGCYNNFNGKNVNNDTISIYEKHHRELAIEESEKLKCLSFDEVHRCSNYYFNKQLEEDFREGRRWHNYICIASQNLQDFTPELVDLSSSIFIMDKHYSNEMAKQFNLNTYEKNLLENVHSSINNKPGVMLAKFITNTGHYSKLTSLIHNPLLLSALSTTAEDVMVRDKLVKHIGYKKAIKYITKNFPYGFKKFIETKKENHLKKYGSRDIVIEDLIMELIVNSREK